jgi:lipoprotein-anchoring transpeptidase ErfK/SrfK
MVDRLGTLALCISLGAAVGPAAAQSGAKSFQVAGLYSYQERPAAPATNPGAPGFCPEMAASAQAFLDVFIPYTENIEDEVQRMANKTRNHSYQNMTSIRRTAARKHISEYREAVAAATDFIHDFKTRMGDQVKKDQTYLKIQKSTFLIYLMDLKTEKAYCAFPMAYGVNPDCGPKTARGDLRTPECAASERTPSSTPFFAGPLYDYDPYPQGGCITRGIGVNSNDPRYDYLLPGTTVMLHGTPDKGCVGSRASHGCIRLLPAHIEVLFDYVKHKAPIVIIP